MTCLGYINQPMAVKVHGGGADHPFMRHALENWGYYAQLSRGDKTTLDPEIISALAKCPPFNSTKEMLPTLSVAARHGLVEVINSQVLQFPDCTPTTHPPQYASPFHVAVHYGQFQAFTDLLSTYGTQNLPLWTSNTFDTPAILHAILLSKAPLPFLEKLFAIGNSESPPDYMDMDINVRDANGQTPLMVACQLANSEDVIRLLLSQRGVEVDARDNRGLSAFHLAAMKLSTQSDGAHLLLSSFPSLDVETSDSEGTTAFMAACKNGHDRVVSEILTRAGDSSRLVRQTNSKGMSALMLALAHQPLSTHQPIVRLLLDHGSDLHARCSGIGYTPFLLAVIQQCTHMVSEDVKLSFPGILDLLLGFDPTAINQCDYKGRTGLMLVTRLPYSPMLIPFLLSHAQAPHTDTAQYINAVDNEGLSALMHTMGDSNTLAGRKNDRSIIVKDLLAFPSLDLHLLDSKGRGMLEIVCSASWPYFRRTWSFLKKPPASALGFFGVLYTLLEAEGGR